VLVVGDIHGHILDLFRILGNFGWPPAEKYLFLGDLVDRGEFSTETILLVLAMKILWPSAVTVIRGNHEFADMWRSGGFNRELDSIYPHSPAAASFAAACASMPLSAIVNGSIICLHAGIGPNTLTLSTIRNLYRPIHVFDEDIISDLLWSDPADIEEDFIVSIRGAGHKFSQRSLHSFLSANGFDLLVRGHECIETGFEIQMGGKIATVFSASTYCGQMHNQAAVLRLFRDGSPPKPIIFQPLKYLLRASASFATSQSETAFVVDPRKSFVKAVSMQPRAKTLSVGGKSSSLRSISLPGVPRVGDSMEPEERAAPRGMRRENPVSKSHPACTLRPMTSSRPARYSPGKT
jgi:protein phosphatase